MNDTYSDLREHTLDDIKQVIDFYRLEITDDPEVHNMIESSLAENLVEWVSSDFEQIEVTSSSFGDDLIVSVCFTDVTSGVDDQFIVVHKEPDMFDNSTSLLDILSNIHNPDLTGFKWVYDNTPAFEMPNFYIPETNYNFDGIEFTLDELEVPMNGIPNEQSNPQPTEKLHTLRELLLGYEKDDEKDDEVVRSRPFVI